MFEGPTASAWCQCMQRPLFARNKNAKEPCSLSNVDFTKSGTPTEECVSGNLLVLREEEERCVPAAFKSMGGLKRTKSVAERYDSYNKAYCSRDKKIYQAMNDNNEREVLYTKVQGLSCPNSMSNSIAVIASIKAWIYPWCYLFKQLLIDFWGMSPEHIIITEVTPTFYDTPDALKKALQETGVKNPDSVHVILTQHGSSSGKTTKKKSRFGFEGITSGKTAHYSGATAFTQVFKVFNRAMDAYPNAAKALYIDTCFIGHLRGSLNDLLQYNGVADGEALATMMKNEKIWDALIYLPTNGRFTTSLYALAKSFISAGLHNWAKAINGLSAWTLDPSKPTGTCSQHADNNDCKQHHSVDDCGVFYFCNDKQQAMKCRNGGEICSPTSHWRKTRAHCPDSNKNPCGASKN